MKCPKCSKDLQSGARFCMHCGGAIVAERTLDPAPVPVAAPTRPAPAIPPAPKGLSGAQKALAIGGGVLLLAAVAFLAAKYGIAQAKGPGEKAGVLQAKGAQPGTGVLQASGKDPGTGMLQVKAKDPSKPITMPADIMDWLKHLERCEKMRWSFANDQSTAIMRSYANALKESMASLADPNADPKPPGDFVADTAVSINRAWGDLDRFYNSKRPPAECRNTAAEFEKVLVETRASMLTVVDALRTDSKSLRGDAQGGEDPLSKLQKMRNDSFSSIDIPAAHCDALVEAICRKYNTDKWFTIKAETPSGSPLGTGSGGGGVPGGLGF